MRSSIGFWMSAGIISEQAERRTGRAGAQLAAGWRRGAPAVAAGNPEEQSDSGRVSHQLRGEFLRRAADRQHGEAVRSDPPGMDRAVLPDPAAQAQRSADQHRYR